MAEKNRSPAGKRARARRFAESFACEQAERERRGGCEQPSCPFCDWNYSSLLLEWHHRDPAKKLFSIGSMIGKVGDERLLREMGKCLLLCVGCHRMLHNGGRTNATLPRWVQCGLLLVSPS